MQAIYIFWEIAYDKIYKSKNQKSEANLFKSLYSHVALLDLNTIWHVNNES